MDRKKFIRSLGATAAMAHIPGNLIGANAQSNASLNPSKLEPFNGYTLASGNNQTFENQSTDVLWASDEGRWKTLRKNYPRTSGIINLENGYFSHQSWKTINQHLNFEFDINTETSRFMRMRQQDEIEKARIVFAEFLDVPSENLAFTRNTTESLNTIILGFPWQAGDEVIIGDQDYGSMTEAFEQAAQRYGIVIKKVSVPQHLNIQRGFPNPNDEMVHYVNNVVRAYSEPLSAKTKMVHITDLINLTGQVIPTDAIAKEIKKINPKIMVVVDAAHSLAHTLGPENYSISRLIQSGVDAIGGSLHKWLCNPIGVGFLVLKSDWIESIWPLMGDTGLSKTNIRKFEHQGTRPIQSLQTIAVAAQQHRIIGSEPKLRRLQYLKLTWMGLPFSELETSLFGHREIPKKYSDTVDLRTVSSSDGSQKIQIYGMPNIFTNEQQKGSKTKSSGRQNAHQNFDVFTSNPIISGSLDTTNENNRGTTMDTSLPRNTYYYQGAIATVSIQGYTPGVLAEKLLKQYGIYTVAIVHPKVNGVRITPHLSSTVEDCYRLNKALSELAK